MKRNISIFLSFLVFSCVTSTQLPPENSSTPKTSTKKTVEKTPAEKKRPTPPALRLSKDTQPVQYQAELTLNPAEEGFTGTISIELSLAKKTDWIWLHANDITITEGHLSVENRKLPIKAVSEKRDFMGISLAETVGPGKATLWLRYSGKVALKETAGLFRQKEGDDWYIFSQLEAIDARRVFPCFDEPSFKVPWQISLNVPKDTIALSNTSVIKEEKKDGRKLVHFEKTKPLPSYLIAVAVGPFDLVDAGQSKMSKTPIRIVTPKGKANEAQYVARYTKEVLDLAEEYFGTPYPYGKLDQVVIPATLGFGAMENPGLVTYNERLLLSKPGEETVSFKRRFISVCAHEIAHQWFGNLVTLDWWNDLWLNEAMASWLEDRIIEPWKPKWRFDIAKVSTRVRIMDSDGLISARRIRQPIKSNDDIENAFDGITYGKGALVLHMFEAWVGQETFRKAIQRYVKNHEHGTATARDFLSALNDETKSYIGNAFSTFLDQPGVPLVSASLQCQAGKTPSVLISQKRYLPKGSQGNENQTWQIPVCVKYKEGKNTLETCKLIANKTDVISLESAKKCPDWVLTNGNSNGYYYTAHDKYLREALLKSSNKKLSIAERVGFAGDIAAMTGRGDIPMGDALAIIPTLLKSKDRYMVESSLQILGGVHDSMITDALRPSYARFIQKMYGRQAKALGFQEKRRESDDAKILRPTLLTLVALDGENKSIIKEATKLSRKWLDNKNSVDSAMVDTVLTIAARYGDQKLFDAFYQKAKETKNRQDRRHLLTALGSFQNKEIAQQAFSIILGDDFESRDSIRILFVASSQPGTKEIAYEFIKANFDALLEKLPRNSGARFPLFVSNFCDQEHYNDVEAFFTNRANKFIGGPRTLSRTLETIKLCNANREAQTASVAAFLQKY